MEELLVEKEMKHVVIPNDYFFKMACKDYYDWQSALVREFIQNSADAGSSEIKFNFHDGFLTICDNGYGMDVETLEKALLTLGGTYKTGESVGGIGKAKEILYFSWQEWEIKTGNILIRGNGCQYEMAKGKDQKGVSSCIRIENLIPNIENIIKQYIDLCSLPGLNVFFNDALINLQPVEYGKKLTTIDGLGDLYENLSKSINGIIVQAHGLYMFSNHAISDKSYVFNITMPSYECLTANRDGFVGTWNDQFNKMVGKVAIDTESINIRKEQIICVQDLKHRFMESEKDILDDVKENTVFGQAVSEFAQKAVDSVDMKDVYSFIEGGFIITENLIDRASGNNLRSMIKKIKKNKLFEDCLAWYRQQFKEGFIIVSEKEIDRHMIYRLYGRETLQLSILWKRIVDFLADKAGIEKHYGYGIVIADNTVARCQDGYLLFNPMVFEELDWDEASSKMIITASEELAHYTGYSYHNESFKCRYTNLLEIALKERVYVDDFVSVTRKVRKKHDMKF
jgi:hypothetical protein